MNATQEMRVPIIVRDRGPVPFRLVPVEGKPREYTVIAGGVRVGAVADSPNPIGDAFEIVTAAVTKDRIHAWSPLGESPAGDEDNDEDDEWIADGEQRIKALRAGISAADVEIDDLEGDLRERRQERRELAIELREVEAELYGSAAYQMWQARRDREGRT